MPEMIPDYYYNYRKRGHIMGFTKKTWKNRIAEYINRRRLTMEDGSTNLVTVARDEGTISQEGDAFNAANMNDLEDRIEAGFDEVNRSLTTENGTKFRFGQNSEGEYGYIINKDGADTVIPFNGGSVKIVDLKFPITVGFTSKTFNVDLSEYTYVLIKSNWAGTDYKSNPEESTLIPIDSKQRYCIAYRDGVCLHRPVTVSSDKIVFGNGHRGDTEHPSWCNPIAIYGVKDLIFIQ